MRNKRGTPLPTILNISLSLKFDSILLKIHDNNCTYSVGIPTEKELFQIVTVENCDREEGSGSFKICLQTSGNIRLTYAHMYFGLLIFVIIIVVVRHVMIKYGFCLDLVCFS